MLLLHVATVQNKAPETTNRFAYLPGFSSHSGCYRIRPAPFRPQGIGASSFTCVIQFFEENGGQETIRNKTAMSLVLEAAFVADELVIRSVAQ